MEDEILIDLLKKIMANQQDLALILQGYRQYQQLNTTTENKTKMPLLIQEETTTMKYNNVTIQKNTKCNSWYTRKRINGKQVYIAGKTQKSVLRKLKNIITENIPEEKKQKEYTLIQWYHRWLELYKINTVKYTTLRDYESIIKNIPKSMQEQKLKSLTTIEIITLLNQIDKERIKQKVYELLKMLMDKAYQLEIVSKNVMTFIDKPKHVREKGIALNSQQQEIFLKTCKNKKYSTIYRLLLFQGLRIGEALALTWQDIDMKENTITINKAISCGKISTTKNLQSNRIIPLFKQTKQMLTPIYNETNERIYPASYTTIQKYFKEILKDSQLPSEISIHDLRHTFVTNCKNKNIPEHIIQSWVGHEIGSKVTSAVYTHVNNDVIKQYIQQYEK